MQKHAERADRRPPIAGLTGRAPPAPFPDHPYWPKISPDSAAHLSEAMQEGGGFGQQNAHDGGDETENDHLQAHHRALFDHHRLNGGDLNSEDARQSLHLNGQGPPISTSGYDIALSKASAAANSAFTPINSMAPHLGGLGHPQLGQRPYLYDSLGFQQKQNNLSAPASASFPNQLISLHQIRNYAHQPTANLLSPEHILPHSLAVKDKQ